MDRETAKVHQAILSMARLEEDLIANDPFTIVKECERDAIVAERRGSGGDKDYIAGPGAFMQIK